MEADEVGESGAEPRLTWRPFLHYEPGLATLSTLEPDQAFTTVDIRINYLRPLTVETGEVRAEGRVLQGGRRLAYCEAKLTDGGGKMI